MRIPDAIHAWQLMEAPTPAVCKRDHELGAVIGVMDYSPRGEIRERGLALGL